MGQIQALFPDHERDFHFPKNKKAQSDEEKSEFRNVTKLMQFWQDQYALAFASELEPNPRYDFTVADKLALRRLLKSKPKIKVVLYIKEFLDFDQEIGKYKKIDWCSARTIKTMCSNAIVSELDLDSDIRNAKPSVVMKEFPDAFEE